MKNKIFGWFCFLPLLLLIPYLSVIFLQDVDTAFRIRTCNIEDFLPVLLEKEIKLEYEVETMKSQAVIIRSNFYRHLEENADFTECLYETLVRDGYKGPLELNKKLNLAYRIGTGKYQRATAETLGKVLKYHNEWKIIPFHEISNGKTRNGEEVFHDPEYRYLEAVDSEADLEADEYLSNVYISASQIPQEIEVLSRDSSGYILCLAANGKPIEGEAFREGLNLASSDITIQKIGDKYRFLTKGRGHGLGLSQYGANVLAEHGSNYKRILEKYFWKLELQDIDEKISENPKENMYNECLESE